MGTVYAGVAREAFNNRRSSAGGESEVDNRKRNSAGEARETLTTGTTVAYGSNEALNKMRNNIAGANEAVKKRSSNAGEARETLTTGATVYPVAMRLLAKRATILQGPMELLTTGAAGLEWPGGGGVNYKSNNARVAVRLNETSIKILKARHKQMLLSWILVRPLMLSPTNASCTNLTTMEFGEQLLIGFKIFWPIEPKK